MGRRERPLSSVIPRAAATRISLYLRYLEKLESLGETTTSSQQLGAALGVTAAQVRKVLGYFGQFGFPGVGYKISHLIPEIRKILGTDRSWSAALVGMGNLGSALFQYRGFQEQGFCFRALFDRDARLVGSRMGDLTVEDVADMPQAIARQSIELGVIAVPADAAQQVADRLVEAGVRGIFNFAPTVLTVPEEVGFVSVDLAIQLEQLSFEVTQLGGLRGRPGRTDVTNGKLTS